MHQQNAAWCTVRLLGPRVMKGVLHHIVLIYANYECDSFIWSYNMNIIRNTKVFETCFPVWDWVISFFNSFSISFIGLCVCVLQAVKFEPYHDSALVRFLLKRALRVSRTDICVFTFFYCSMWVCIRVSLFVVLASFSSNGAAVLTLKGIWTFMGLLIGLLSQLPFVKQQLNVLLLLSCEGLFLHKNIKYE